jgi:6-phosphogluconolactonase (cycloisomerase 2 family)
VRNPRSFNVDPTVQFLYCCNQRGDNVAVFQVDRKTGGPAFTGHYMPVGNPSIIVFVALAEVGWSVRALRGVNHGSRR